MIKASPIIMLFDACIIGPFNEEIVFRKTLKDQSTMNSQMKGTIYLMLGMVVIASISLPVALGIYWITSSLFTVAQNKIVEGKKEKK